MGHIFKHIPDIKLVRNLFAKDITVVEKDETIYDDRIQSGNIISIFDGTYDLVPVEKDNEIVWDVWIYEVNRGVRYYSDGSGEPDWIEERELGSNMLFKDAIKLIRDNMFETEYNNVMEDAYMS